MRQRKRRKGCCPTSDQRATEEIWSPPDAPRRGSPTGLRNAPAALTAAPPDPSGVTGAPLTRAPPSHVLTPRATHTAALVVEGDACSRSSAQAGTARASLAAPTPDPRVPTALLLVGAPLAAPFRLCGGIGMAGGLGRWTGRGKQRPYSIGMSACGLPWVSSYRASGAGREGRHRQVFAGANGLPWSLASPSLYTQVS